MVVESADHCGVIIAPDGRPASWCSPGSCERGVGAAVGDGAGVGSVGGWVTNVITCGADSVCPVAVLALGPIVTWYWVLGARLPLLGWTERVLSWQLKV